MTKVTSVTDPVGMVKSFLQDPGLAIQDTFAGYASPNSGTPFERFMGPINSVLAPINLVLGIARRDPLLLGLSSMQFALAASYYQPLGKEAREEKEVALTPNTPPSGPEL